MSEQDKPVRLTSGPRIRGTFNVENGHATVNVNQSDMDIADLERAVVEAAVAHRNANMEAEKTWKSDGEDPPDFREKMWAAHSAMDDSRITLHAAVDALIAVREKVIK